MAVIAALAATTLLVGAPPLGPWGQFSVFLGDQPQNAGIVSLCPFVRMDLVDKGCVTVAPLANRPVAYQAVYIWNELDWASWNYLKIRRINTNHALVGKCLFWKHNETIFRHKRRYAYPEASDAPSYRLRRSDAEDGNRDHDSWSPPRVFKRKLDDGGREAVRVEGDVFNDGRPQNGNPWPVVGDVSLLADSVGGTRLFNASFSSLDGLQGRSPEVEGDDGQNQSPKSDGIGERAASRKMQRLYGALEATCVFCVGLLLLTWASWVHADYDRRRRWGHLTGPIGVLGIIAIWLGCLVPG